MRDSLSTYIGDLSHDDEENLLKGLLRQKEVPAFFIREERGNNQYAVSRKQKPGRLKLNAEGKREAQSSRLKAESARHKHKAQSSKPKAQRSRLKVRSEGDNVQSS